MIFLLTVVCNMSIAIAAVIAAWRFKGIHPAFRPFIYCIWLALFNEVLSVAMVWAIHSNAVNANIYVLLESVLIVWQFREWGLFERFKSIFTGLFILLIAVWLTENFILFSIRQFSSWFRIFYSFVIVLLAISLLNRQIIREKGVLLKNPVVLICLGFIVYYTYKVLVEAFWLYGLNENGVFQTKVYFILNYVNLLSNCMLLQSGGCRVSTGFHYRIKKL